jgi:hypothetical protein
VCLAYIVSEGLQEALRTLDLHFAVPVLQRIDNQTQQVFVSAHFARVSKQIVDHRQFLDLVALPQQKHGALQLSHVFLGAHFLNFFL